MFLIIEWKFLLNWYPSGLHGIILVETGDSKRVKMRYIILDFKTAFSMPCLSHLLLYEPNIEPVCYAVSWLLYGGSSCTPKNHCAPSAAIDFSGDWENWVPACRIMPNCKLDKGTQAHAETACFPLLWPVEHMACSGQISSADRSCSVGLTAFACQDGWSDTWVAQPKLSCCVSFVRCICPTGLAVVCSPSGISADGQRVVWVFRKCNQDLSTFLVLH